MRYLKQHNQIFYTQLLISGKLNNSLSDINEQATDMFSGLVKQMAEREGIPEKLKAENHMVWAGKMNNNRTRATETVDSELIYV